jgi:hypothetical protein
MLSPMFKKLAAEQHFSLAENVVQGCPWPENLADTSQTQALQADCQRARDGWYETALRELKPRLVVLAMRPRDDAPHWAREMKARSGPQLPLDRLMLTTMDKTVQHLEKLTPRILMVQGVMGTGKLRPLDCLAEASAVGQCAVPYPLSSPPSDGYMEALAAGSTRASTINLNRIVCPTAPVCLPYRKGQIVWRDQYHLMTGFAESVRAKVWNLMGNAGALRSLERK